MNTPRLVAELIGEYVRRDPRLDLWRRWPDVTDAENAESDRWACEQVSVEFAAFAAGNGVGAVVVRAERNLEHPDTDYHCWTRLRTADGVWCVDWTARQYENVDGCGWVLDEPWPLVWTARPVDEHPVVGRFGVVAERVGGRLD